MVTKPTDDTERPPRINIGPEIARMVDDTRSRISQFMTEFRRLGLVSYGWPTQND
jgi:hypothetical protein